MYYKLFMDMHKKNKGPKRTFIPQAIGDSLKKINRSFSSKFSKLEFIIQSKWPEISGSYFSEFSEPRNITRITQHENEYGEMIYKNQLNVSVSPAAALEFQHFKDTIIDKINSYFGYKAVLDLRIQQNYIPRRKSKQLSDMNNTRLTNNEQNEIAVEVENLNSKDLKKSLIDLGKNIAKDNK